MSVTQPTRLGGRYPPEFDEWPHADQVTYVRGKYLRGDLAVQILNHAGRDPDPESIGSNSKLTKEQYAAILAEFIDRADGDTERFPDRWDGMDRDDQVAYLVDTYNRAGLVAEVLSFADVDHDRGGIDLDVKLTANVLARVFLALEGVDHG